MPVIKLETAIGAPVERVFDLSRSIDLHRATMDRHQERAVAGVTRGLIALGETVTWEARHFGVRQRLTTKITAFDRPVHFRDSMVAGAFARFDHDHYFAETGVGGDGDGGGTLMTDVFDYDAPLWILGKIADRVFLEKYMRELLLERNRLIKSVAESAAEWRPLLA